MLNCSHRYCPQCKHPKGRTAATSHRPECPLMEQAIADERIGQTLRERQIERTNMSNATADQQPFEREERYIVVKRKHLDPAKEAELRGFLGERNIGTVKCIVVESDWPEYEHVWTMIEARCSTEGRSDRSAQHTSIRLCAHSFRLGYNEGLSDVSEQVEQVAEAADRIEALTRAQPLGGDERRD